MERFLPGSGFARGAPTGSNPNQVMAWVATMKIYLLILMMGILLTAVHLTTMPKPARKPVSN